MMRTVLAVVALMVWWTGACATTPVEISHVGSSVRAGRVGVAGLVRVRGDRPVHDITLRVAMRAGGDRTAEHDTLAYCPPASDCWWGTSFEMDGVRVSDLDVEVVETGEHRTGGSAPRELSVSVDEGEVRLRTPGREGVVYLLTFSGEDPRFAISFVTRQGERSLLRYSRALFPLRSRERPRAFFYPGRVSVPGD